MAFEVTDEENEIWVNEYQYKNALFYSMYTIYR